MYCHRIMLEALCTLAEVAKQLRNRMKHANFLSPSSFSVVAKRSHGYFMLSTALLLLSASMPSFSGISGNSNPAGILHASCSACCTQS